MDSKASEKIDIIQVEKASEALLKAKKPVIYAGGGVVSSEASFELKELNKLIKTPVTNTLMGLGSYPGTDQYFLGLLGMHGTYEANMAIHEADLIIALGSRFDDRVTNDPKKFAPRAKIIHFDIDPSSVSRIIKADIAVIGQIKTSLKALNKILTKKNRKIFLAKISPWHKKIKYWKSKHGLNHRIYLDEKDDHLIFPQAVVQHIWQATEGKAFICSDVGQHQMFAAQYYLFNKPRKWINSGGAGTMGFGLPAAIGVQLAYPDKEVVCITGEGSIQMCIQELSTCLQYNLPIKIFNLNNSCLGMIKQWQKIFYSGRSFSDSYKTSLPNFVKLAESFGHIGIKVSQNSKLKDGIKQALAIKNKLVFVDIHVNSNEAVYPMLIESRGSMKDMWLSKDKKTN